MKIQVRRAYDEPSRSDGTRVLVDRIWPRGLRKDEARLDEWAKDVAPSTGLRRWYDHDPAKFVEFRDRYRKELATSDREQALEDLRGSARGKTLTLLTATTDVEHSNATVLADVLCDSS